MSRWTISLFAFAVVAIAAAAVFMFARQPAPPERTWLKMDGDPLAPLDQTQRKALMAWIAVYPAYEVITVDYCACATWSLPARAPYAASGDFNGDKQIDFAVMLQLAGGPPGPAILLVFNGPIDGVTPVPVFKTGRWQTSDAIFEDVRDGDTVRLFVGPDSSDNGYSLEAKGATYQLIYAGDNSE